MRPLPPLPPSERTFTEPETTALLPPVFPWFVVSPKLPTPPAPPAPTVIVAV